MGKKQERNEEMEDKGREEKEEKRKIGTEKKIKLL